MSEIVLKENIKEDKLGVVSVPKLLAKMSLPAIFSMLIMSLYNIVDGLFVAKSSLDALEALNLAFPLQQIMLAFALGIGVGTSTIVARRLGEKNKPSADNLAQNGLKIAIVTTMIFMILGSFLPKLFMQIFTQKNSVVTMGTQYLTICMVCCFGMMIEITISKVLQATGNMIIPMLSQLLGAITNIVFDPIFIFVCDLGIIGAGIATVMGQIFSMIFVLILASRKRHVIDLMFKIKHCRDIPISFKAFKEIVRIGLPVMIMNAVAGIIVIFMNKIISGYNPQATNALGNYFKLQSFVFMPVFGLNQGALPIMSYNFGANKEKRYMQTFLISLFVSLAIMTVGLIIFQLCPEFLISFYKNESDIEQYNQLVKVGVVTLRVISWSFLFAAVNIIVTTGYQAIGYGVTSLIMSLLRQVILILPLAILFGKFLGGLDVLWWSYPVSDAIVMIIFTPYYFFAYKKAFAKRRKIAEVYSPQSEALATTENNEESSKDVPLEALVVSDTIERESQEINRAEIESNMENADN